MQFHLAIQFNTVPETVCPVSASVSFAGRSNELFCHDGGGGGGYFTTDGQSVSMPWYRASLWDLRPDITSCLKFSVLFLWGALSDGGRVSSLQCSHSMVRVAQNP
jgi:hypothetical protein